MSLLYRRSADTRRIVGMNDGVDASAGMASAVAIDGNMMFGCSMKISWRSPWVAIAVGDGLVWACYWDSRRLLHSFWAVKRSIQSYIMCEMHVASRRALIAWWVRPEGRAPRVGRAVPCLWS